MTNPAAIAVGAVVIAGGLALVLSRKSAAAGPVEYCCPYEPAGPPICFPTFDELVAHIQLNHPGERIPIEIDWG